MKKNLLGWLAMAAMLVGTGCSTDEVVNDFSQGNAIQFGTYVGRNAESRATVINDTKLATDGFGVFAYYTDGTDFVASGENASTPNFMYNQEVAVKTNETEYSYSPVKYWPNESTDKLSFFAYAPYSPGGSGENFTFKMQAGVPTVQFTVNNTVKEQEDLLWAAPHLNLVKNTTPGIDVNDKVKFEFKHALSRIGFEVQTMIDKVNDDKESTSTSPSTSNTDSDDANPDNGTALDADTKVVVKEVSLKGNFVTSGTLSWTSAGEGETYSAAISNDGTASETTYTLTAGSTTGNTNFYTPEQVQLPVAGGDDVDPTYAYNEYGKIVDHTEKQLNAADSYIMVVPQDFTNKDLTITVTYDVVTVDPKLSSGLSNVVNKISSTFRGVNFEAGKAYTFSLHLGLTSVKLEAEVEGWNETDGKDWAVNVPLNIEDNDSHTGGTGGDGSN